MSQADEWIAQGEACAMKTYNRFPVVLDHGDGAYVWDVEGKQYLDFVAGIAVNSLGSNHPKLVAAISEQAGRLVHCSNLYYTPQQVQLAELLTDNTDFDKAFFCNSGAEAVEASLKLCRKYAVMKQKPGREIITALHSFHGRTYGAVTATGQAKYQTGLDPLMPDIKHVPYNDLAAMEAAISVNTCGVLLEVIQGEGGMVPAQKAYLEGVRALCDKYDVLLIFDEVQSGVGRTGFLFAYQYMGVIPDGITAAKGLAGGVPIGALLTTDKAATAFAPGDHASTFGGNPLACAAGCVVLTELLENALLEQVQRVGAYLTKELLELQKKYPVIQQVRGVGLMQGIELSVPAAPVVSGAMELGLLLVGAGEKVVRFVPPLIVTETEVDVAMCILQATLSTL